MQFIDLQNQINEKVGEIKGSKSDVKWKLQRLINDILEENKIDARAGTPYYFGYESKENLIKIYPRNRHSDRTNWPVHVYYKTSRKTERKYYGYNESTFTLKSVEVQTPWESEDFESWLKKEDEFAAARENQKAASINKLKAFIEKNPEFEEMVALYNKYKYQLK